MADSILDNQVITADILNDIAIDLGHTSFNGFGEEKFGTDALNAITGNLVGAGILSSYNKCKPTIQEDKVQIDTGIIVFNNGAKKKITENGIYVDLINSSYIYALNNTVTNTCSIIVSQAEPADGDFVNIASIGEDGTLVDRRTIAKAKVELPAEGNSYYKSKTIISRNEFSDGSPLITLPTDGVSRIFIVFGEYARYVFDVATQTFSGLYKDVGDREYIFYSGEYSCTLYWRHDSSHGEVGLSIVSITDSDITFKCDINTNYANESMDYFAGETIEFYTFGGVL